MLYWRIVASQRYVSFCCATKWISHMYTYVACLLGLLPTALPASHHHTASCASSQFPASYPSLHATLFICQCYSPHSPHPPLPSLGAHVRSLYPRFYSCLGNRFICTIFKGSVLCTLLEKNCSNLVHCLVLTLKKAKNLTEWKWCENKMKFKPEIRQGKNWVKIFHTPSSHYISLTKWVRCSLWSNGHWTLSLNFFLYKEKCACEQL